MSHTQNQATPFRLIGTLNATPNKKLNLRMEKWLENILSLKRLGKLYSTLPPSNNEQEFSKRVIELFNLNYQVAQEELQRIPETGPMVVVANHPFGAIEGIIMLAMLKQIRPDVKIMANSLLSRIPEVKDSVIAVNPFGGNSATRSNVAPMKEALRWIKSGGLLVVFPSGTVSHFNPVKRKIVDPAWSPSIGRLIHLAKAPVQSVYFHGNNSTLFQAVGLLHPLLRTAMLPRELLKKTNTTIPVRIGYPLPYSKMKNIGDDHDLIDYMQLRTYMLRDLPAVDADNEKPEVSHTASTGEPIIEAPNANLMNFEIQELPPEQHLVDNGDLQVYYATAKQVPWTLREIGRLRELTFRATGEGTGKSIDLDKYDDYYLHLFIWNLKTMEVVGAYRLGLADEIMSSHGKTGLYTYSLFKYSKQLVNELSPALELGRSFVRQEYQKSFAPLMLLWKGIGQFVGQNPQYRRLFGPVSISADYQSASQQLMVEFLKANVTSPHLSQYVKPRKPFKSNVIQLPGKPHTRIKDIDGISHLISDIEADKKGIPILLKQYLKLGGRILEFNVDDQFSNALDGLIMVDLVETDPKVLNKYMSKNLTEAFFAYHQTERVVNL